ncbi:hypothetical protein AX16_007060 [Volvariella volvacea WC 439]|nr:hypothetical protein AX16_007060 [Volvariella volvacea WC 439]
MDADLSNSPLSKRRFEPDAEYEKTGYAPTLVASTSTLSSSLSQSLGDHQHVQKRIKTGACDDYSTITVARNDQGTTHASPGAAHTANHPRATHAFSFDLSLILNPRTNEVQVEQTYIKHPRFWAPDGNVLLQIGITRFRVHQSRIAYHSPWFRKLFDKRAGRALNANDEDEADLNDIKVEAVVVKDDQGAKAMDLYYLNSTGIQPTDFEALLKALDDCIDFFDLKPSFSTVASMLRSSTILKFPHFLKFSKNFLKEEYSNNLEDITADRRRVKSAAEAIILGREWNLPHILKRAFYELVRSPDVLEGYGDKKKEWHGTASAPKREHEKNSTRNGSAGVQKRDRMKIETDDEEASHSDSSMEISDDDGQEESGKEDDGDDFKDPAVYSLSSRDLVILLNAQKKLTAAWISILALRPLQCPSASSSCSSNRASKSWSVIYGISSDNNQSQNGDLGDPGSSFAQKYQLDPICGLNKLIKLDWRKKGYCMACANARVASLKEERAELWEDLDSWFGLEDEE